MLEFEISEKESGLLWQVEHFVDGPKQICGKSRVATKIFEDFGGGPLILDP